jgi:hypothetical protein
MLNHNVLEPYKFINVSSFMLVFEKNDLYYFCIMFIYIMLYLFYTYENACKIFCIIIFVRMVYNL